MSYCYRALGNFQVQPRSDNDGVPQGKAGLLHPSCRIISYTSAAAPHARVRMPPPAASKTDLLSSSSAPAARKFKKDAARSVRQDPATARVASSRPRALAMAQGPGNRCRNAKQRSQPSPGAPDAAMRTMGHSCRHLLCGPRARVARPIMKCLRSAPPTGLSRKSSRSARKSPPYRRLTPWRRSRRSAC